MAWWESGLERMEACINGGRSSVTTIPGVPLSPAELAIGSGCGGRRGRGGSPASAPWCGMSRCWQPMWERPGRRWGGSAAGMPGYAGRCPPVCGLPKVTRQARRSAVAAWEHLPRPARPDFASVNLSEPGSADLPGVLASAGVAAEAGVWSVADAESLAATGTAARWLRILVEISGAPAAGAVAAADEILRHLDELGVTPPRLLHGEEQTCWPLLAHAGTLGLPSRIGLEDTTVGPGGAPVSGNAELMQLALGVWAARDSLTPARQGKRRRSRGPSGQANTPGGGAGDGSACASVIGLDPATN